MNKEPFECMIVDNVEIRLQKFPHIAHRIAMLWGTQECINYIEQVLTDTDRGYRPEPSIGFDAETAAELMRLLDAHPKTHDLKKKPKLADAKWATTDHAPLL